MYYKCSICKKALQPKEVIKLKKGMYDRQEIINSIYFCSKCYPIFEQRLKDYLLERK